MTRGALDIAYVTSELSELAVSLESPVLSHRDRIQVR